MIARATLRRIAAAAALCATMSAAHAQDTDQETIRITSRQANINDKNATAEFSGDVNAVQGGLILEAENLRVIYADSVAPSTDQLKAAKQIRRLEAQGNVIMTNGDQMASADEGVYDPNGRTMTLTGNARATQGDNVVTGHTVTIDIASGVTRVAPGPRGPIIAPGIRP